MREKQLAPEVEQRELQAEPGASIPMEQGGHAPNIYKGGHPWQCPPQYFRSDVV